VRVLVADFDIFRILGGGQVVYRQLIKSNPDIDFYYLTVSEPPELSRPANAYPVPLKEVYSPWHFRDIVSEFAPSAMLRPQLVQASNIAAAVAGENFDIVDVPDYAPYGALLRPALRHHGVRFGRLVLALHGRISTTISLNWSTEGTRNSDLEVWELIQYHTADVRYAISRSYLDEWASLTDLDAHHLCPLKFLKLPEPSLASASKELPALYFIGRTEKRKGPDIFIDLLSWLPRATYGAAVIAGPDSYDPKGVPSSHHLTSMARQRNVEVSILPALDPPSLATIFAGRNMVILPSRYDSLNLVALESLFSGCPTAIGSGAGVCRLLTDVLPSVPFVRIDVGNVYAAIPEVIAVLENYDWYRRQLVEALKKSNPDTNGPNLCQIYMARRTSDFHLNAQLTTYYEQFVRLNRSGRSRPVATALAPLRVRARRYLESRGAWNRLRMLRVRLRPDALSASMRARLATSWLGNDARIVDQALKAASLRASYRQLLRTPEQDDQEITTKVEIYWRLASQLRIDRVWTWKEIARLERLRGNDLVAAAYELRVARLLGRDCFGQLPATLAVLERHGFADEAQVARCMYGEAGEDVEACGAFLDRSRSRQRQPPTADFEFVDDRRPSPNYRVSIIVSLYNAATKLRRFLSALQNQTLLKAGVAELVLVETGSAAEDYRVFRECMASLDLPAVYARRSRRETIQSAWNRGIVLSRAPYLCFLGVDETLRPECLELLVQELDADSSLDWVQANSLVTQVDERGSWRHDIMVYDRTGGRQELAYLETCYLSWVGALYRRSLHERFGFYDATFRAAGDTEFKNRVLPFITVKFVPRTLGIFWNYPDDRTTQSPVAELEDLRAWYLHRTVAGVRYAFSQRDWCEVESLFYDCLRYRKSYCRHWSTDVEYGSNLLTYLRERAPRSAAIPYYDGLSRLLAGYRSLEWLPRLSPLTPIRELRRVQRLASGTAREHRFLGNGQVSPVYEIFNDNRHEQHSFTWKS